MVYSVLISGKRQGLLLRKRWRDNEPSGSHPYLPTKNKLQVVDLQLVFCGKAGIRTLGTRKGTTVFETAPIDHSGTFPRVMLRLCCGSMSRLRVQSYEIFLNSKFSGENFIEIYFWISA